MQHFYQINIFFDIHMFHFGNNNNIGMISKTPQKKNSIEIDKKTDIKSNNSCTRKNQSEVFWGNQQLQKSIFKSKPEQSSLKNSQAALAKKGAKGALGIGRKYPQQDNIFKKKTNVKQYQEVVISDQFVRSSKIYKMLKQQVAIADARHLKQAEQLNHILRNQDNETRQLRNSNHQMKLELWQLRNQLVELKTLHEEEEEENKKLVEEYEYLNAEGEEQEMQEQQQNQQNPIKLNGSEQPQQHIQNEQSDRIQGYNHQQSEQSNKQQKVCYNKDSILKFDFLSKYQKPKQQEQEHQIIKMEKKVENDEQTEQELKIIEDRLQEYLSKINKNENQCESREISQDQGEQTR